MLGRLDLKQSDNNNTFRKKYKKINSEYSQEVKLWQDQQEKKRSEMIYEKETKMKENKSADRKEDKED